ncbi:MULTISPECIES: SCO6880 family protein [Cellulomonas]|uniref:SCO6880 family protein n=1 Tax=Cellulomonas TaxID=1707 RepID=UPI0015852BF1|nr:SCO6880 family protein [Cellulomonas humilata]
MSTAPLPEAVVSPARFGRLEHRGVLLGLSVTQLVVVGVATFVAVTGVYSAGASGLLVAAPLWVTLLVAGTVSVAGRPVVAWLPLLAQWRVRRATGSQTSVTSARARSIGDGLVLPGIAGRLAIVGCDALGGALIADRRAGTVTAVLRVHGSGFVLDEVGAQEHKVAAWGRVLGGLCQQPSIVRVQLLMRIVPGGLSPARAWWREHCTRTTGVSAALASMLDDGFVVPHVRETLLAVAVRSPQGHRALSADGTATVAKQLQAVATSLSGAALSVQGWLDRAALARTMRSAYDPDAAAPADETAAALVGPMGIDEHWDHVRLDTSVHATYWVSEWPRSDVHPAFLQPMLLGETTARTATVIAEPLSITKALREIRRAKVEHIADAAQRARIGQVEAEATRAEVADLDRREAELVAGHGDLRFTGLFTVSAPDLPTLEQRCVALETAAAQSMCEVRRLVGQQGLAHLAAAVPLARGVL